MKYPNDIMTEIILKEEDIRQAAERLANKINDEYEIHILLNCKDGLNDFIIKCSDVELKKTKLNKGKKIIKKRNFKRWKNK